MLIPALGSEYLFKIVSLEVRSHMMLCSPVVLSGPFPSRFHSLNTSLEVVKFLWILKSKDLSTPLDGRRQTYLSMVSVAFTLKPTVKTAWSVRFLPTSGRFLRGLIPIAANSFSSPIPEWRRI